MQKKRRCVIIGSFRKHYPQIVEIIELFEKSGVEVLSPHHSSITNPDSSFVRFAYNPEEATEREIQDDVLSKMHQADVVYVVDPKGYVGLSVSFEIGYCFGQKIPVFLMEDSEEIPAQYALGVMSPEELLAYVGTF